MTSDTKSTLSRTPKTAPKFLWRVLGILLLLSTVWLTTCQALVGTVVAADDRPDPIRSAGTR